MKLILLRGPSGTGKSTIARHLANETEASLHETDQFFVDENGIYRFNVSLLSKAHAWNQREVRAKMLSEIPLVIVSNTFIKHWEMQPYLDMASEMDYDVEIIRTAGPWDAEVLFKRNKHGVPMDVLKRQIESYQPHPEERNWINLSIFK